jgi:hypothetical protein
MHWQLHPCGKIPQYPFNRRLGGPQIWSGHGGEKKISRHCPFWELKPPYPACSLVCIMTATLAPCPFLLRPKFSNILLFSSRNPYIFSFPNFLHNLKETKKKKKIYGVSAELIPRCTIHQKVDSHSAGQEIPPHIMEPEGVLL